jgi:hypothetical protein
MSFQTVADSFSGLFWLLATLFLLIYLQRKLHSEIVAVFLLLTRRMEAALIIFSIIFFPGVLIHELSHWLAARLLGVRTGKIWLIPERMPDGRLRMGYVETARAGLVRDALIGLAPLLAGGAFVAYAGLVALELDALWGSVFRDAVVFRATAAAVYARPDFWLWFYLLFVVSSMMLPSESDRAAWGPLALFAGILLGLALLAGAGAWMLATLAPLTNRLFGAGAAVFGMSLLAHGLLLLPVALARRLLSRAMGWEVV